MYLPAVHAPNTVRAVEAAIDNALDVERRGVRSADFDAPNAEIPARAAPAAEDALDAIQAITRREPEPEAEVEEHFDKRGGRVGAGASCCVM